MSFSYAPQIIHIFDFSGQSNASGGDPNIPPTDALFTAPNIFMFSNAYKWIVGIEPSDDGTNQVDMVSYDGRLKFYSMTMSFARELQRLRGSDYAIAIVPCARGGSTISEWQPAEGRNTLYGSCLNRINTALKRANTEYSGKIVFQGEADTGESLNCKVAKDWGTEFAKVIRTYRSDLGGEYFPVVFFQLGPKPIDTSRPCWDELKHSQYLVDMWKVEMVWTMNVPRDEVNVHYKVKEYDQLGILGARKMNPILP